MDSEPVSQALSPALSISRDTRRVPSTIATNGFAPPTAQMARMGVGAAAPPIGGAVGGPPAGGPPLMAGGGPPPTMARAPPMTGGGGPPQMPSGPPRAAGAPPMAGGGGPPQMQSGPPRAGAPIGAPPMGSGGFPAMGGGPPQMGGAPPMNGAGPHPGGPSTGRPKKSTNRVDRRRRRLTLPSPPLRLVLLLGSRLAILRAGAGFVTTGLARVLAGCPGGGGAG